MKKPTATQNSASTTNSSITHLPLQCLLDRLLDGGSGGGQSDQALDDRGGGLNRDAAHVAHRGRLARPDGGFRPGELGVELGLETVTLRVRLGIEPTACLAGDRLRAGAGFRERLLVSAERRLRLVLEALRLPHVVRDAAPASREDRADA